jgi:toxin-antitoxin system PIN domain toxin
MQLCDINVWLALVFESHVHHSPAKSWFDGLTDETCYFSRLTQLGFLRLATNPRVFGPDAVTLDEAWRLYDASLSDPQIAYAEEPTGLDMQWRGYTAGQSFTPSIWNDAYLAAFAVAGGYEIATFDRGFAILRI